MIPLGIQRPRGQPARIRSFHLPAPIGGDDTVSPATAIPAGRSILSRNLIGAEYGLRSRLGWREWVTGLGGEQVRSLLPFAGSTADGGNNRLFACTTSGIWDVSASTATPTKVVTFGTQNGDSGWGCSCVFVTSAGHFLVYTDEANGLYTYAESGAVWTAGGIAGTPVTGVNPALLSWVLPWKNRLWFVERNSARAWYLGLGAVSGAATSFQFGNRFQRGGDLRCLASWTGEGGVTIDDRLVAVGGGGDIVIYQGTDPASASTFGIAGVWYAGQPPAGRRLTTDNGGELLYMSSLGVLSLATLTSGNSAVDRRQYQTFQIANLFNQMQAGTANLRGWAMRVHPQDSALMLVAPTAPGVSSMQLVESLITKGWHRYTGLPMGVCAEPWEGSLYFGTDDGRVCVNDGYVDGVTLADPNSYSAIDWSLVTAYSQLGSPVRKRLQQIRVKIMSQGGSIPVNAEARYGLDISEATAPPPAALSSSSSAWDSALWDSAIWGGYYQEQTQTFGACGSGADVALAIRGLASSRMTLVGADVSFDVGGWR